VRRLAHCNNPQPADPGNDPNRAPRRRVIRGYARSGVCGNPSRMATQTFIPLRQEEFALLANLQQFCCDQCNNRNISLLPVSALL